jgi:Emfourin
MRNHLAALALSASIVACSSTNAVTSIDDSGLSDIPSIELTAEGGIAALSVHHVVRGSDRSFVYTQRQICGQKCNAPLDSASGTLSASTTDSLFTAILAQSPFSLKDDYGITQGGADMMTYVLQVNGAGHRKTIRADDGTMPEQMRQIVQALRSTIADARK